MPGLEGTDAAVGTESKIDIRYNNSLVQRVSSEAHAARPAARVRPTSKKGAFENVRYKIRIANQRRSIA
jgi:hypothetical protein